MFLDLLDGRSGLYKYFPIVFDVDIDPWIACRLVSYARINSKFDLGSRIIYIQSNNQVQGQEETNIVKTSDFQIG